MSKFVVSLMFLALICPTAAFAQKEISDADRQAVAAYTEKAAALEQKTREARKEIREKNSILAKALGQAGADFKEADVIAAHQALTAAYAKITAVELEEMLFYKSYHPDWKPEDTGRRVIVPGEGGEAPEQPTAAKDAPQEKKAE